MKRRKKEKKRITPITIMYETKRIRGEGKNNFVSTEKKVFSNIKRNFKKIWDGRLKKWAIVDTSKMDKIKT